MERDFNASLEQNKKVARESEAEKQRLMQAAVTKAAPHPERVRERWSNLKNN